MIKNILENFKFYSETSLKEKNSTHQRLLMESELRYNELVVEIEKREVILIKIRKKLENSITDSNLRPETRSKILKIIRTIQSSLQLETDWNKFKEYFEKVNETFLSKLKREFPNLTPNEIKLCSMYRMNNNYEEVASNLEISLNSARVMQYRLKKKLSVPENMTLNEFLNEIDKS